MNTAPTHEPRTAERALDEALIRTDQLQALAFLLSFEDVTAAFSGLSNGAQAAIFGLFEQTLQRIRLALSGSDATP